MFSKKLSFLLYLISGIILVVGCGGENPEDIVFPTQAATIIITDQIIANETASPEIGIELLGSEEREFKVETVPQNNCGGSAEVENVVEKSRSVSHTMEVGGEYRISASGEVKILGTGVELGTEVATMLGYGYGAEESLSRSITVKASPGTNMEHTISLLEVYENGEASVDVNGILELVPFSFRDDFAIKLVSSRNLGCPTAESIEIEPNQPATPTLTATNIPEVVDSGSVEPEVSETPTVTNTPPVSEPSRDEEGIFSSPVQLDVTTANISAKITKIEVEPQLFMKWTFRFESDNEDTWDIRFSGNSYVVDEFGNSYELQSVPSPVNLRQGGVEEVTLSFAPPEPEASTFTLHLFRYGSGYIAYARPAALVSEVLNTNVAPTPTPLTQPAFSPNAPVNVTTNDISARVTTVEILPQAMKWTFRFESDNEDTWDVRFSGNSYVVDEFGNSYELQSVPSPVNLRQGGVEEVTLSFAPPEPEASTFTLHLFRYGSGYIAYVQPSSIVEVMR